MMKNLYQKIIEAGSIVALCANVNAVELQKPVVQAGYEHNNKLGGASSVQIAAPLKLTENFSTGLEAGYANSSDSEKSDIKNITRGLVYVDANLGKGISTKLFGGVDSIKSENGLNPKYNTFGAILAKDFEKFSIFAGYTDSKLSGDSKKVLDVNENIDFLGTTNVGTYSLGKIVQDNYLRTTTTLSEEAVDKIRNAAAGIHIPIGKVMLNVGGNYSEIGDKELTTGILGVSAPFAKGKLSIYGGANEEHSFGGLAFKIGGSTAQPEKIPFSDYATGVSQKTNVTQDQFGIQRNVRIRRPSTSDVVVTTPNVETPDKIDPNNPPAPW